MLLANLRPIFYRVGNALEARSGWIDPETGNIMDTTEGNPMAVEVVPNARPAFSVVGQRVEFTSPVEIYPRDFITPGERAHVAAGDHETGAVDLFLEAIHDGLQGNTLTLTPFHDDETLAGLRVLKSSAPMLAPLRLAAAVLIALGLWQAGECTVAVAEPLIALLEYF